MFSAKIGEHEHVERHKTQLRRVHGEMQSSELNEVKETLGDELARHVNTIAARDDTIAQIWASLSPEHELGGQRA